MTSFRNVGEVFTDASIAQLKSFTEWSSPQVDEVRTLMEDLIEKRLNIMLDEEQPPTRNTTSYYWTSYVLRRLGYCFSVSEMAPQDEQTRPDFTLFNGSDAFLRAASYRGHREFFLQAVTVVRAMGWLDSLDSVETEEGVFNPAIDLERYMRQTGMEWGILTNGRLWRLLHRDTAGQLTHFFEVDLIAALESNDLEDFKYFWMMFSPAAFLGSKDGGAILPRIFN